MTSRISLLWRPFVLQLRVHQTVGCVARLPRRLSVGQFCTTPAAQPPPQTTPDVGAPPIAVDTPPVALDTPALIVPLSQRLSPSAPEVRQAWVENMDTAEERKLGLVELHPEVFAAFPKIHLIHQNVHWQRMYRHVDHATTKTRAEVRGGGRKPWPQKGTGRARHGSIRSPIFKGGGVSHGPRGPKSHFFMLAHSARVGGLCATLSVKLAQNDLHVVRDLQLPAGEAGFLQQLADTRRWGPSVLFVDDTDEMPENISSAVNSIQHFNLLPVYGLNVYSMLKHTTLVLTFAALERLQERLLRALAVPENRAATHKQAGMLS